MTIERAMNCGGLFIYRVIVCLQVPDKQQQQVGFCSDHNLNTVATLGGIKDSSASSQNSLELDCLARFAVDEHNKKETTLMQACQYDHWEVVLILVFFKANVICMELVYLTDLILKVSHLLIKLFVFHVFLELQAATPAPIIQNDVLDDDDDDEPLNDNDDDDDLDVVDQGEDLNTQHLVLAQFDKVTRTKSKWKCTLKDGIMRINNKNILFNKVSINLNKRICETSPPMEPIHICNFAFVKADYLNGGTALHLAALNGHSRCIRILLADYIPSVPNFCNILNKRSRTEESILEFDRRSLYQVINSTSDVCGCRL
ncbi:hypothetical protein POM88_054864 [Heracleum sosnowskyi]|uniref:ANK_REP_REGION domain-containing protein n=1 Tax=Heracleum sosnowskyi TaxID=360622 RepID=A0AAD8GME8_9APIA|nr:hypothetical protein POM88_054864 [Heracleum sosnowskyi]